jgi:hypothetical protein
MNTLTEEPTEKPKLRPGRKSKKPPAEVKKTYNATTYKRNLWAYKLRHTFYTYPNIPIDHKEEITDYFMKNGDTVDEALVSFVRSFVVHKPRGRKFNTEQDVKKQHRIIVPSQLMHCIEEAKNRLLSNNI